MNIACDLVALTEAERDRREALAGELRASVIMVSDLPDGYAFHLNRDRANERLVFELIALERKCCSFLTFATRIDPGTDTFVLDITGGEGVREFVKAQFKEAP